MSIAARSEVERIAREYDRAWNAKDIDAILARHAEGGTYRLHVAGAPTQTGREAIRTAFTASLANWAEIWFELERVLCADGFYVWQSTARGVLARPLAIGATTIQPNGASLEFGGCDVITLDDQGMIASKETYFDILAAANQAAAPELPRAQRSGST